MSSDLETTSRSLYLPTWWGYRLHGDLEVDDVAARRNIVDELGIRVAFELNYPDEGHVGMQLHPADTGGSFLEMDQMTMKGGGEVGGPWWPAGKNWRPFVRTDRVSEITAATISSPDPSTLATRWAEISQTPFDLDDHNQPILEFDNARIRFVQENDGRGERLSGIDVRCGDIEVVLAAATTLAADTQHLCHTRRARRDVRRVIEYSSLTTQMILRYQQSSDGCNETEQNAVRNHSSTSILMNPGHHCCD